MANDNNKEPVKIPTTSELLEQIQLRKAQKEEATELETERMAKAAREANMESIRKGEADTKAKREQCPHKKPYGESAIAGQRMHSHKYQWICQYCQEQWIDGELPSHLRIDGEKVGGPSF